MYHSLKLNVLLVILVHALECYSFVSVLILFNRSSLSCDKGKGCFVVLRMRIELKENPKESSS